ncbi:hypothetical protein [Streptomyces sp. HNM0574]|uniref:hypothetical protein n=1 Tax=Streptomyces sp. HNM0574 TaxID=2714954 RepID=UPI00146C2B8E|nr:hypothetical protein [Streptomyces sp. HNM0574]NLU70037.1 hypothetical protein [Streptomyces sp. HNM0574]
MRRVLRPVVVGLAVLGLAGVGAGSAQAMSHPKHYSYESNKSWDFDLTKIWEKEIEDSIIIGDMNFEDENEHIGR